MDASSRTTRPVVGVMECTAECGLSKRMLLRSSSMGDVALPSGLVGVEGGRPTPLRVCRLAVLDWAEDMGEAGVDENSVAA